jgi:hypothetical protein
MAEASSGAVDQRGAAAPSQSGLQVAEIERLGRFCNLSAAAVEDVEDAVGAAFLQVALAQEAAVVVAHQQPEIRLLAHEGLVHQPLVHDHAAHRQRESGVRADPDGHEVAAVDRRGAVVGCDGDDVAAVVAGLGEEVVPRKGAVGRVVGPDQQQLGVEPVVVAMRRVEAPEVM